MNTKNWNYLRESFQRGKLSHAYLFCGPEGTGKLKTAIDFIRMANSLEMDDEKILQGYHPDVYVIRPVVEEKRGKRRVKDISIDQFQVVFEKIGLYAYQAPYKFLVVERAEKLTATAANSLLKLIEEPPKDTIVVMTASSEEAVLPTIRSRCQRLRFGLQKTETIVSYLKQHFPDIADEAIQRSADLSHGRIMLAAEYIRKQDELDETERVVQQLRSALRQGIGKGIELAASLSGDKERLIKVMEEWIWYLSRFQIRLATEGADMRMQRKSFEILSQLRTTYDRIKGSNANDKLQLESFFVAIS